MRTFIAVGLGFTTVVLCGCPAPRPAATFTAESLDHSHERDKMLLADAGHYHAALTAHMSQKDGNELDVFFETADLSHKPVPLPFAYFKASVRTTEGTEHVLEFEPAPKEERKDDPDGLCSHFVAKAGWMKPTDLLTVTVTVSIHDKPTRIEWPEFNPAKYAHHMD